MQRGLNKFCPDCGEKNLDYVELPESKRSFVDVDGGEFITNFGRTRDYSCRNCDCEFTLTQWEDEHVQH